MFFSINIEDFEKSKRLTFLLDQTEIALSILVWAQNFNNVLSFYDHKNLSYFSELETFTAYSHEILIMDDFHIMK